MARYGNLQRRWCNTSADGNPSSDSNTDGQTNSNATGQRIAGPYCNGDSDCDAIGYRNPCRRIVQTTNHLCGRTSRLPKRYANDCGRKRTDEPSRY